MSSLQEDGSGDHPAGYSPHSGGFSEADMEKPMFRHRPRCPKVAFLLSDDDEHPVVQVPATINQHLRDYQREGIKFLYGHFRQGRGALLGDDMGLGKTIQVIAFVSAVLGKTGTQKDVMRLRPKFIRALSSGAGIEDDLNGTKKVFLIIGPATVMYNWIDELDTWGHFNVGKFHKNHKSQTLSDLKKEKLDVVMTTFETCRDNIDVLNQFEWTAVIADEAHKIKGWKAEASRALKQLKCRRRFALTGTALQNTLLELWCVLDWCNPGCLGDAGEFENLFDRVIKKGQKHDATKRELAEARKAKEKFAKLRGKWMLRRTKQLIADELPKKYEKVVYCQPTSLQLSIYKAILAHRDMRLVLSQNMPCSCDSGLKRSKCCYTKTRDGFKISTVTMTFMHLLIKAANHIALLIPGNTPSEEQQKKGTEICQDAFKAHPEFLELTRESSFHALSNPKYCGKMKVLAGLLSVFKKQRSKVLIFSLSTQLLTILEQYVISVGYEYRRMDGKTPNIQRTQLVREFNKDPDIFLFLASTRAGGVGLNLTGADVVVIYDPNWNPSHDLQAQDRAYRLGQGRDVQVFRLICSGTIEENVYLRQVYKQQLDNVAVGDKNAKRLFYGVQGDKFNKGELFGIENMFALRASDQCFTADVLKRNSKVEKGLKAFHVEDYVPPPTDAKSKAGHESELDESHTGSDGEADAEDTQESDIDEDNPKHTSAKKKRMSGRNFRDDVYGLDSVLQHDISDLDRQDEQGTDSNESSQSGMNAPVVSKTSCKSPIPSTSRGLTARIDKKSAPNRTPNEKWRKHPPEDFSDEELPLKLKKTYRQPVNKEASSRERVQLPEPSIQYSFDSVTDAFNNCGVIHTHANHEMIAHSKVEDHVSRCAIQDVFELHQNTQQPAIQCDMLEESSGESDDLGAGDRDPAERKRKKKVIETEHGDPTPKCRRTKQPAVPRWNKPRAEMVDECKVLIGQTPKAIRMSQFELLAAFLKCSSTVEAAKQIAESSAEERCELLKNYYISQDQKLCSVYETEATKQESVESERSGNSVGSNQRKKSGNQTTASKVRPPPKRLLKKHNPVRKGLKYDDSTDSGYDANEPNQKVAENKLRTSMMSNIASQGRPSGGIDDMYGDDTQICTTNIDHSTSSKSSTGPVLRPQRTLVNDMDDFLNFMTMPPDDSNDLQICPQKRESGQTDRWQDVGRDRSNLKNEPFSPKRSKPAQPVRQQAQPSQSVNMSQTFIIQESQQNKSHADKDSEQENFRKCYRKSSPINAATPIAGNDCNNIVDELFSDTIVRRKAPAPRRKPGVTDERQGTELYMNTLKNEGFSPKRSKHSQPVKEPAQHSRRVDISQTFIIKESQKEKSHSDSISGCTESETLGERHRKMSPNTAALAPNVGKDCSNIVDELLSDTIVKRKAPPKRRYIDTDVTIVSKDKGAKISSRETIPRVCHSKRAALSSADLRFGPVDPMQTDNDNDSDIVNDLLDDFFGDDSRWKKTKKPS